MRPAASVRRSTVLPWMLVVAAVCLVPRVALFLIYEPVETLDTSTYVHVANRLAAWDFNGFGGERTPGYPLLLLFGGLNYRVIWLLQALLGVATALLLFALMLRQTSSRPAALIAGLGCGLSLNLIFGEASMLTEPLTAFLIVLAVFLYARLSSQRAPDAISCVVFGVVLSLAALTRPQLLILIPLSFLFLLRPRPRPAAQWTVLLVLLPPAVLICGWCTVVWKATGSFTPTTLLGYNLTQHSGAFFEHVPDEDAQLRDIFLRYRAAQIESTGSASGTIWPAKTEMMRATGLGPGALSKELTRVSLALFAAQPRLYLESVRRSWLAFWDSKIIWERDRLSCANLEPTLLWIWDRNRTALRVARTALLPALLMYLVYGLAQRSRRIVEVPLFVLALVGSTALVQALLEAGANERYAIPFQPLIIFLAVAFVFDAARVLIELTLPKRAAGNPN